MSPFEIGDQVLIGSPGHRQDGRRGEVAYRGQFFGTIGVEIDGRHYGFLPSELTKEIES